MLIPPSSSSFFPSLLLTALVEPSAQRPSPRGGGVVPAERARLEPQTRDLSGVSRTPWVFSLFMWRNRIKSVAASRVGGWDYSRTVTGQVTPGIPCNRFFLADLSFLSLPLSPRNSPILVVSYYSWKYLTSSYKRERGNKFLLSTRERERGATFMQSLKRNEDFRMRFQGQAKPNSIDEIFSFPSIKKKGINFSFFRIFSKDRGQTELIPC